MVSPENDSSIKFTKALEKLDKYLDQYLDIYDLPQCVLDRMEELNKVVDNTTDKALKEYQRIKEVSFKLALSKYDFLLAKADKEPFKTISEIRSRAAEMRWLAAKMRLSAAEMRGVRII